MDKEKLIIRLSTQIDTIKAHVNRLKKSGYDIHSLDVDMLRKKTIEFYELVFELENNSSEIAKPEKAIISEPVETTPPVSEIKEKEIVIIPEEKEEDKPNEADSTEIIEQPEIVEETKIEEVVVEPTPPEPEPIVTQPQPVVEPSEPVPEKITKEKLPEIPPEDTSSPQTTYDLFSGNSDNPVAEKFQASEEQSFADKMQKSSITNIREAIGINEKFLFINELFNGDLSKYNKILDDINALPSKKGVDTYLLELKIQYQWADDNEAFGKLKELLERKFSS